jgi:tripartite-type tricarboxylate transporter receptor subunit TctC
VTAAPVLLKSKFDPLRDIVPLALIGEFPFLLAGHPNVPARNAGELIALAKRQPGTISYGSTGVGSAYHLAAELLGVMAGVDMLHVPYRGGGAAALSDVVAGRVDLIWNSPVFLLPHVHGGKLRGIGVTGPRRLTAAPDIPTIAQGGVPGYEVVGWQGMFAPAGTPDHIVTRLNAGIGKILVAPDVGKLWESGGLDQPVPRTTEQFGKILRSDYEKWEKLIKRIGL